MECADVEFLRRLVFEHEGYHRVLRIGYVGKERFFPGRLVGHHARNLVAWQRTDHDVGIDLIPALRSLADHAAPFAIVA